MASSQASVPDLCGSEIERFLDAVQQHPCVYDTKRMDYRDAERKINSGSRYVCVLQVPPLVLYTCPDMLCTQRLFVVLFSLFQSMSA